MNLQVMEASAREVFEAYVSAIERNDVESIMFWRPICVERLVMLHGAIEDYLRHSGTNGTQQKGS